jgi:hypothetical protein
VAVQAIQLKTTQMHSKLNGLIFLHIMHIIYTMVEYVLEMTFFNSQTCPISKELKHWECVF